MSWAENDACATCGRTLLPLTYAIPVHDDPRGRNRPLRKCSGCGRRYPASDDESWQFVDF